MIVFPDSKIPGINRESPHLPNVFTALGGAIFTSSEHVTAVTSAKGSVFSGGGLAPQSQWPVGVAPTTSFAGTGPSPLILAMTPQAETVSATMSDGHEDGGVFYLKGLDATLHATTAPGQVDHVTVDAQHAAIGYQPGRMTTLDATLIAPSGGAGASAAGRSAPQRTAEVRATSTGGDTLSFPAGNQVVVQHTGASARVAVTLSAIAGGVPVAVQLPTVDLAAGQKLTVAPRSWAKLGSAVVRLTVSGRGRTRSMYARGKMRGVRFARVSSAKLQRQGMGDQLVLHLRSAHAPANAAIEVVASIRRGRHTVARPKAVTLSGAALRSGTAALSLAKALAHGVYTVSVELIEASQAGVRSSVTVHQALTVKG
jgi:hypothetical protein